MKTLRKFDESVAPFLNEGAKIMFQMFAALALIICILYQWAAVAYPYSMDYGEAPLVDQAMRLAAGQNIYRADISTPPYTISNYPPLYIALLAISVKLFGPASTFLVGRMISALCAWIAALCIYLIIYRSTQDRFAGLSAGFIFLAFPFVMYWSPLLRIDMLALALSLGGLCVLTSKPDSRLHLIIASLLIVAAIYTRQSYAFAAPLAGFTWLLARDLKQALRFAALVGSLSLILFILLNLWTQGGFYFNIVTANVNEFKMDNLTYHWKRFRDIALILLFVGGASFFLPLVSSKNEPSEPLVETESKPKVDSPLRNFLSRRLNPLWTLTTPYLIGAAMSAATISKIGANVNYLLELCAALSFAAGAVVAWSRAYLSVYTLRATLLILLAFAVGRMMHFSLGEFTKDLRQRQLAFVELSQLASLVKETSGPILADEYMGMLTLQGRPLTIQPFEVTQLAWAGKWDQTPLLEAINKKEFSAIIIYDKPWANERWTQEMFDAIDEAYVLSNALAENRVFLPYQVKATKSPRACPGAVWQLPSDSTLGVKWEAGALVFYGHGNQGAVPVYAVADGLLWRLDGWTDAVIVQHDDPLEAGRKIWTYYSGMSSGDGNDSFVAEDFPIGVRNIPVKAGQLLGYQGSWSGNPQRPMWVHVYFGMILAWKNFPEPFKDFALLNPSSNLSLALKAEMEMPNMQALSCGSDP